MTDKVLIIIRGLPGSGKSFLAEAIRDSNRHYNGIWPTTICEADDFFNLRTGKYEYVAALVSKAHQWCFNKCKEHIELGDECVIVSNTATRQWEYKKYIDLAREYGYKVQVIDVHGEFENVHGVPEEHLTKMEERWEPFDRQMLRSATEQSND